MARKWNVKLHLVTIEFLFCHSVQCPFVVLTSQILDPDWPIPGKNGIIFPWPQLLSALYHDILAAEREEELVNVPYMVFFQPVLQYELYIPSVSLLSSILLVHFLRNLFNFTSSDTNFLHSRQTNLRKFQIYLVVTSGTKSTLPWHQLELASVGSRPKLWNFTIFFIETFF